MEWINIALSGVIGALIASVYMAALWVTVLHLRTSARPAVTVVASAVLRIGAVAGALLVLSDLRADVLFGMLAGFILTRLAVLTVVNRDLAAGTPAAGKRLGVP